MKRWFYIFVFSAACLFAGHINDDASVAPMHSVAESHTVLGEYLDNCQQNADLLSQTMVFTTAATQSVASHENRINVVRHNSTCDRSERFSQSSSRTLSNSLLRNTGVRLPRVVLTIIGESSFSHIKDYYVFLLRHIII